MLLNGKTAVIYGAAGAIGGAVARAFAREGAKVFLTGRRLATLDKLADDISGSGGQVETAQIDALDEGAVEKHLDLISNTLGGIDISFNAVGFSEVQGVALIDLSLEDFLFPLRTWPQSNFLTSRAAARRMAARGSGVILMVMPPAAGAALAGGFGAACATIESLFRTLAAEIGPKGVRVLCLQPNALPESAALQASFAQYARGAGLEPQEAIAALASATFLRRLPTLAELGDIAAFLASDRAIAMTGQIVKADCGSPQ
jgi:3-oxoacyl-[acyl-carrier protein] reductase